jgi:hypothetical protein
METLRRVSRSIQPGTPVSMPWGYAELFMNRRTCLKVSEPFLTFRYEDCQSIVSPTSFPLQVQKSFSKRTRRQDQPQRRVNVFVRRCTSLDTRQMFSLKLPPIINEVNTWPLVAAIPHSPAANVGNSLKLSFERRSASGADSVGDFGGRQRLGVHQEAAGVAGRRDRCPTLTKP